MSGFGGDEYDGLGEGGASYGAFEAPFGMSKWPVWVWVISVLVILALVGVLGTNYGLFGKQAQREFRKSVKKTSKTKMPQ